MKNFRIIKDRPAGFFAEFDKRPKTLRHNMHYCPGCGHGVLHKIVAEAIAEFGIKDRTTFISPVGCAVFGYYYMDCFGISTPHGRAPAVATGLSRAHKDGVVISYQGDGDLAAIGFNEFIHTVNRGENICYIFVNNAIYGMTGGQMAPTTLVGQRTSTTPNGRDAVEDGIPFRIAEIVASQPNPVYVERVSLGAPKEIMKARAAIRKAIKNTMERKGLSFVEVLSPCPIGLKKDAAGITKFIDEEMTKIFPLGKFKDVAAERAPVEHRVPVYDKDKVRAALFPQADDISQSSLRADFRNTSPIFDKERRIKVAGSGGQGVLSLAYIIAHMGRLRNFNVTYLPTYGPEMRGGTADCSVVASRREIASPIVDSNANMLVALNQPSLDKYLPQLKPTGIIVYDSSSITLPPIGRTQVAYGVPAAQVALELGSTRYGNSLILGAIARMMEELFLTPEDAADFSAVVEAAIRECFADKPKIIPPNLEAFRLGKEKSFRAK
ncbi:MAG: 2-oxoacid:acceptor oxidoreductase family protein [Candidatus Spyradosoma sp.]